MVQTPSEKKLFAAIILVSALLLIGTMAGMNRPASARDQTVLVPTDSYPPFQIFPYDGGEVYGEVISVLRAVVSRVNKDTGFNLTLSFTEELPFKRCLAMMKNGQAQLIGGLLDKDDRKEYLHLIPYKPNSNKVFVLRKNQADQIHRLSDMEGKIVGTVLGYTYFKEFDDNLNIQKSKARDISLSVKKLAARRVDLLICSENQWHAMISEAPEMTSEFRLAKYRHDKPNPVNIGIAKNSWLGQPQYIEAFETAVKEMNKTHYIVKIIADFYKTYSN